MTPALRLAWRNLWRHRRRTWLTVAAIAFMSALLVVIITLQLGAYDLMIETSLRVHTGEVQIQRRGYQDKPSLRKSIPDAAALARRLERELGLHSAARAQGFALVTGRGRSLGAAVAGVEPEAERRVSSLPTRVKQGRWLSGARAREAVLGAGLARSLNVAVGDELTLLGAARDGSVAADVVPVVGVLETGSPELDRSLVQIPLGLFQEDFAMGDHAHLVVLSGAGLDGLEDARRRAAAALPPGSDLAALGWKEFLPGLDQLIRADKIEGWCIYAVLVLVVTFSIANTFLMNVLERTREFGVTLALGATPLRIAAILMAEALLLTLLGLILGTALGLAVAAYFRVEGLSFAAMREAYAYFGLPGVLHPKLSAAGILLGPAAMLLFTMAASLYPALKIRRLQPVEAMREP